MAHNFKAFLVVFILLLVVSLSSTANASDLLEDKGTNKGSYLYKGGKDKVKTNSRKLLGADLQDYDDVCANPKHDPRKKGCKNIR